MPPKGAGSWPLAGGRNSTAACTKEENPNFQLWGAVRLFCLLPPKRKGIATSTNQVELLKITGFLSPRQYPFFAPVALRLVDAQLLTLCPRQLVHSKCVYLPFVDVLAVTANVPERHLQNGSKGRKMEGQGLQTEGVVMCILHLEGLGRN